MMLVVDDDAQILMLVAANVRAWGHRCVQASTPQEARDACATHRPDLMLLDLAMPGVDGATLLRELRAEGLAPPRIVLVSAVDRDRVREVAADLEVAWLSKPFSAGELRAAVEELFEV